MPELEMITVDEATARLLVAYRRSGDGGFLEALSRPFTNPIEQRNDKGKRRIHPLVVVGLILLILAGAALLFFSFRG